LFDTGVLGAHPLSIEIKICITRSPTLEVHEQL
jgi:hypothetical protein